MKLKRKRETGAVGNFDCIGKPNTENHPPNSSIVGFLRGVGIKIERGVCRKGGLILKGEF